MARNLKINGVTYQAVPSVQIPLADTAGNASFWDTSDATADASKVLAGYKFYNASGLQEGTASVPNVTQHTSTKILTIS